MKQTLEETLIKWLKDLNIKFSKLYLREKLLTHPEFPSALSITDTLDSLGVENAVIVIDKDKLMEIPVPFLAYSTVKGGTFTLVKNIEEFANPGSIFFRSWDGVIILAEGSQRNGNDIHEIWIKNDNNRRVMKMSVFLAFSIFMFIGIAQDFSGVSLGMVITTLAGLFIAGLIVQHELGYKNEFAKQLCEINKTADCDEVLNSRSSFIFKELKWADAGLIYFSSLALLLIGSFFTSKFDVFNDIFAVVSFGSLPFLIYSLYFQKVVIKKWCVLCLITVAILGAQFLILIPVMGQLSIENLNWKALAYSVFVYFLISTTWLYLIKPLLKKEKELTNERYPLLRIKNNSEIFDIILKKQRIADVSQFKYDLQIGNSESPVQVMVACGLYCGPCAKTHLLLEEAVAKHDIGCTIRLSVNTDDMESYTVRSAIYLLQLLKDKSTLDKRKVLHSWYTNMNLEKFSEAHPLIEKVDVLDQLHIHSSWFKQCDIKATPTLFINGYEWPRQYSRDNLVEIVGEYLELVKKNDTEFDGKEGKNIETQFFIAQ